MTSAAPRSTTVMVALAVCAAMLTLVIDGATASARSEPNLQAARHCQSFFLGPDPMDQVTGLRAHGLSCKKAKSVAKASRAPGQPFDVQTDYWSRDFTCHGGLAGPQYGKGYIHFLCTKPGASMTFDHQ